MCNVFTSIHNIILISELMFTKTSSKVKDLIKLIITYLKLEAQRNNPSNETDN